MMLRCLCMVQLCYNWDRTSDEHGKQPPPEAMPGEKPKVPRCQLTV